MGSCEFPVLLWILYYPNASSIHVFYGAFFLHPYILSIPERIPFQSLENYVDTRMKRQMKKFVKLDHRVCNLRERKTININRQTNYHFGELWSWVIGLHRLGRRWAMKFYWKFNNFIFYMQFILPSLEFFLRRHSSRIQKYNNELFLNLACFRRKIPMVSICQAWFKKFKNHTFPSVMKC